MQEQTLIYHLTITDGQGNFLTEESFFHIQDLVTQLPEKRDISKRLAESRNKKQWSGLENAKD